MSEWRLVVGQYRAATLSFEPLAAEVVGNVVWEEEAEDDEDSVDCCLTEEAEARDRCCDAYRLKCCLECCPRRPSRTACRCCWTFARGNFDMSGLAAVFWDTVDMQPRCARRGLYVSVLGVWMMWAGVEAANLQVAPDGIRCCCSKELPLHLHPEFVPFWATLRIRCDPRSLRCCGWSRWRTRSASWTSATDTANDVFVIKWSVF